MRDYPLNHIKDILSENPALSVFLKVIREFGGVTEPQELFDRLLNVCINIFNAEGGSVMLLVGDKRELVIKSSEGLKREIVEKVKIKYGEGIAGWVAKELEPLLIIGENSDPRFTSMKEKTREIKDSIIAPICMGNRVFGIISLNNRIEGFFTKKDKELLTVVANIAAMIVEKTEQMSRQEHYIEELGIITNVTNTLGGSLDEKEVYKTICDLLKQYMNFSIFAVFFMDEKLVKYTPIEPIADSLMDDMKLHFVNFYNSHNKDKISADKISISLETDFFPLKSYEQLHVGSFLDMPLSHQDRIFGNIYIADTKMDAFKETDMEIFSIIAEQGGVAVYNAFLYTMLQKQYKELKEKIHKLTERSS